METEEVCLGRFKIVIWCFKEVTRCHCSQSFVMVVKWESRNAQGALRDLGTNSCEEDYVQHISFAWLIVYDRLSKSISKNPSLMTHRSHNLLMHKKSLDVQIMKTYFIPTDTRGKLRVWWRTVCSLWWNHGKKTSQTAQRKWLCKQGCCLHILWWAGSSKQHEGREIVQPLIYIVTRHRLTPL